MEKFVIENELFNILKYILSNVFSSPKADLSLDLLIATYLASSKVERIFLISRRNVFLHLNGKLSPGIEKYTF